ncbi:platelet-derived growth factor receptor alpha [Sabethes cyaneus]|uniref:platelet-derived growth factor receptor alpha n=1 Tax=Sabethes cyaneus TaxID=53552 RepID=UPI00237D376B|nr:platelet-derived growth factor receptor alpha [Sabethes cyaneus]XP_053695118.1 platelet-derived growth factor receptor alpha [Sabethes cyaneus]
MDLLLKVVALAFIILFGTKRELLAEDLHELQIHTVRYDSNSDLLQLNISWETALEKSTLYQVSVHHVATANCSIEHTPFANKRDIKCAPIVTETEQTTVLIPRDPHVLHKHECVILALCTYEVVVKPLDYVKSLTEIYQVPECVEQVCSCYYERSLPNISTEAYVSDNQLAVNWIVGDFVDSELPDDVELDHVLITVRRGQNEDLVWGGMDSSKKSVMLPATPVGSYFFNVTDFPGQKTIFLVHARLYDSRRCYADAVPNRVFLPNDATKKLNRSNTDQIDCIEEDCACQYLNNFANFSVLTQLVDQTMVVTWNINQWNPLAGPSVNLDIRNVKLVLYGPKMINLMEREVKWNDSRVSIDLAKYKTFGTALTLRTTAIDVNGCEKDAPPLNVIVPEPVVTLYLFLILFVVCSGAAVACIGYKVYFKKRRFTQNWREVYVTTSFDRHHQPMQMEENRLYTDLEILEARARGDADMLEVPHSCLRIGREIGKGAFGRVFMASASKLPGCNGILIVAIKQLKKCPTADEFDEFLDEIAMLKRVGRHPNIVTLLGCCTIKEPLTMIMEYIGCGDLLEYLRKIRSKHLARVACQEAANASSVETISLQQSMSNQSNNTVFGPIIKYMDIFHTSSSNSDTSYITQPDTVLRPSVTETMYTTLGSSTEGDAENVKENPSSIEYVLDHNELHDFARQIACGMQHLEEKQITHRDLAARNILIDERKTLKISDFGLSRTGIYVNTRNKKVPLRWLSIEAMRDNLYSNKSDVWAFGIVLWEIGTLGGYPYPTVSNHELLAYLHNGNRLERPEICSTELYKLMLNCWKAEPENRPSFQQISKSLQPHHRIYIDFNEIEPTYVFPPTSEQIRQALINNK